MLMIAEGTLHHPVTDQEHRMAAAWLVPMIDAGFLHGGWIDTTEHRLWMVISATDLAEAQQRLDGSTLRAGRNCFLHPHPTKGSPNLLTAPPSAPSGCTGNTQSLKKPLHLRTRGESHL
jgi:hypothetical protein